MHVASALQIPSPEIVPWVDSVSFLSYKESCVNNWQRMGRKFSPAPPASQQVSIRLLLAVSSLLLKATYQTVSLPHLPTTGHAAAPHRPQDSPTWARIPYPTAAIPGNRRHSSVASSQLLRQKKKKKKRLIDPLMHSQVKKIIKKCIWWSVSQLFSYEKGLSSG